MDMILAALALAKSGMHVFPIREGTKTGHRGKWKELATDDPLLVTAHWTKHPGDNIGIACGPSRLTVLDVDVKKGQVGPESLDSLEILYGSLPSTLTATTASGGLHLYFKSPPSANTVNKIGNGLDTRGEGGYVVAPPSILSDGSMYKWDETAPAWAEDAPTWLLELIGAPREHDPDRDIPTVELDDEAAMARAERHLKRDATPAVEGEGGNDVTYTVSCAVRDMGISEAVCLELMDEHYSPRCEPPWDPEELERVVQNAYNYASGGAGASHPGADFEADETDPLYEGTGGYAGLYDDWVWVAGPKWFVRRSDGKRMDKQSFDSLFDFVVEKGHVSDEIFGSKTKMRKFHGLQFIPTGLELSGEDYNLWKPGSTKPLEGGAPWLEEHTSYLFSDDAGHVLDYMAHLVQRRGDKMAFAPLIQGVQGTGKSWLGNLLEAILGEHNVERPTNDEMRGDFSAWALKAELVVIEELMASGRQEMANRLKPMITDTSVRIHEKHRTPYSIENHMNFLIFTNHEDPIPIEHGDRRYMVIMSNAKPRDETYYIKLFNRLKDGTSPGQAMGYFLARDLSKFNGMGRAPATAGKERMRRAGMTEVEAVLLEKLEGGDTPFDGNLIAMQDVVDCLPDHLKRTARLRNLIGRFLRVEASAVSLGQHRVNSGSARRVLWSIRRHEMMAGLSVIDRAELYDRSRLDADFSSDLPVVD